MNSSEAREVQIPPAGDAFASVTGSETGGSCDYCSCTDERACLDKDTDLPCQMVATGICSVCAKELYCGWPECPICRERGVAPVGSGKERDG